MLYVKEYMLEIKLQQSFNLKNELTSLLIVSINHVLLNKFSTLLNDHDFESHHPHFLL